MYIHVCTVHITCPSLHVCTHASVNTHIHVYITSVCVVCDKGRIEKGGGDGEGQEKEGPVEEMKRRGGGGGGERET